jgi:photosystem II stability/assembly factor-like uncharacterized protein
MKEIIFALLFIPSILFSQWVQQNAPSNILTIASIDFCDANTGAACGVGNLYNGAAAYTTNSGVNWFSAQIPDSTRALLKVQFINNYTGYAAGSYNIIMNYGDDANYVGKNLTNRLERFYGGNITPVNAEDFRGLFLKTTDGGRTWVTHGNLPANVYYLLGIKFINENTGFATASLDFFVNIKDAVLKTTNGGLNWVSLYTIDTAYISNIYTLDGNNLFVAGTKWRYGNIYTGMILKTSNGGSLWDVQMFNDTKTISDVHFPNPSTGFAVSHLGIALIDTLIDAFIYKTTNNGINWVKLSFQNPRTSYESVEFVPGTGKGIAVGWKLTPQYRDEGLLISRTTNYGMNWSNYFISDTTHDLRCSSIADANVWFTGGGIPAIIYKSTNGGAIGIQPISSEIPNQFSLSQNYPNPFNPTTRIKFAIPTPLSPPFGKGGRTQSGGFVRITIYDILGREVAVLVNEQLNPGTYEVTWDASDFPSGVYFYQLSTQEYSVTKKMVLIK